MEASVPFMATRAILRQTGHTNGILYIVNAGLLAFVYLVVRILVFPLVYWLFAHQRQIGLVEAAASLPTHCHLGTMAILLFQAHWFRHILISTKRVFNNFFNAKEKLK
jgi:hypothetical protein